MLISFLASTPQMTMMYQRFLRPLLFQFDPERIHHLSFRSLQAGFRLPVFRAYARKHFQLHAPALERQLWGLTFPNPLGLAAGFDKDALIGDQWETLGFGFVEMGTVTPRPQAGNPRKRLFRLPADQAIVNRMGFNNAGVDAMVERLKHMQERRIVLGANIGKNKDTPNERAIDDYQLCFDKLFDYVDYFVVNVSSPNTPGLRSLQEKGPLTELLSQLQQRNQQHSTPRPLLLKIAPDLTEGQLDDILAVAQATRLSGLIATNTTISRHGLETPAQAVSDIGAGGLSGLPLRERSLEVIRYLHQRTQGELPLIGVGGIMRPEDALQRLQAGAALVQTYTGFVYNGPAFPKRIMEHLLEAS